MVKRKKKQTECSGMEWQTFLALIEELKRDKEYSFALMLGVGCYCGLRISDILSLQWKDILKAEQLTIQEKKTSKVRNISLNPALRELVEYVHSKLQQYELPCSENDYVFANRWGGKLSLQYTNRKLHSLFARYKVKVKNGSSHCMRKTFGKRLWDKNNRSDAALVLLSQIFCHSSTAITRRYIGIQMEEIENAYLNL